MKKGKVWGETLKIYQDSHVSVHLLRIFKGGYSSKHRHKHKQNYFVLISGKLEILTWMEKTIDRTILFPNDVTSVPTGCWHKFLALEDSILLEFYLAEPLSEDIERDGTGGLIEPS